MLFKTLFTLILCSFLVSISARDQPDTLNMDEINEMIKDLKGQKNYIGLGKYYVIRAEKYVDMSLQSSDILIDLRLASQYFRLGKDTLGEYETKFAIARTHMFTENFLPDALEETQEALNYFQSKNDVPNQAKCHVLMGQIFEKQLEYDKAIEQLSKAEELTDQINNPYLKLENGLILTRLLSLQSKAEQAIILNKGNLEKSYELKDPLLIFNHLIAIGRDYLKIDETEDALLYLQRADSLQIQNTASKIDLLKLLKEFYSKEKEYELAYSYQEEYIQLSDKLNSKQKNDIEKQMRVLSSEDENEREITSLTIDISEAEEKHDQTRAWAMILLFGVLASLLALFYIIRFYTQKLRVNQLISSQREEIDKQKITELENDIRIKSLSSMVKGQEAERNRIATDLHDSLGGTLSALKLQFENIFVDHAQNSSTPFKNVYNLIDGACSEVREIARNLKPSALDKIGLVPAIRDLINKYSVSSMIDMSFYTDIENLELDYQTKLNLYRIIQELLNNAIKHAESSEIDIQLTKSDNEIIVKVEDDGIGFVKENVTKGLGLDSIQSRVNLLSGELTVDSASNMGSSFIIQIPHKTKAIAKTLEFNQSYS